MQTDHVTSFAQKREIFEAYGSQLNRLLKNILEDSDIKGWVDFRAKGVAQFAEKLRRPGKSYTDPLSEMTDLTAARVICLDNDSVDHVRELICANFVILEEDDKRRTVDVNRFGYASVHLIVRPNDERGASVTWRRFRRLPAEIQVRTMMAHAWAVLSHDTQYTRETEVPIQIVRRMARLSALLEVADEELVHVKRQHEAVLARAVMRAGNRDFDFPPDLLTLRFYLENAPTIQTVIGLAPQPVIGPSPDSLKQLMSLVSGLAISALTQLDDQLVMVAAEPERCVAFLRDRSVTPYVQDRASIVLLLLLLSRINTLDRNWLEERLNWQEGFVSAVTEAIQRHSAPI